MTDRVQTQDAGQLSFVKVCTLADLPQVGAVQASFDGRLVAIARDSSGEVHAFDDTCTHANVSLSEGELDGGTIECWLHGSRFDMTSGEPTGLPATQPIAIHAVQIEGEDVFVALTDEDQSPRTAPQNRKEKS